MSKKQGIEQLTNCALAALSELVAEFDAENERLSQEPGTIGKPDTSGIKYARTILGLAREIEVQNDTH